MLKTSRGTQAELDLGRHYVVNLNRNAVYSNQTHIDLVELGRELGLLREYEHLAALIMAKPQSTFESIDFEVDRYLAAGGKLRLLVDAHTPGAALGEGRGSPDSQRAPRKARVRRLLSRLDNSGRRATLSEEELQNIWRTTGMRKKPPPRSMRRL